MKPSDLQLPLAAWRPGQWEALQQLVACSDAKYLLLEAPTGLGKSPLAIGVGRLIGDRSLVLVGTKQLQEQYVKLGPLVAMGRGNFPCAIEPRKTADEAICTVGQPCDLKGTDECAYYRQKNAAACAPEAVLNYPYWLAMANYANTFTDADLLVCDEAHLLEDELRRFASCTLRKSHLRKLGQTPGGATHDIRDWRRHAEWLILQLRTQYNRILRGTADEDDDFNKAVKSTYEACRALSIGDDENWVMEPQPWGWTFRPVWVAPFTHRLLLRHAKHVLFMSATILDKGLFCRQLGLPEDETAFIRAPSHFPKASRPLYYQPVGKVKSADPDVLDRLVLGVDRVLDQHPGDRGLIHTVSYKLTQHIMANSRHQERLITHDTGNRLAALGDFARRPGAVLVSPSVTTGVDLPYDNCRFQIIAKLAFPDLTDRQIKKRMKLGPDGQPNKKGQDWYNWATACALVQAYGRGMRAVDDSCTSYLLDGNWDWFQHAVKDMLPGWFTEAIIKVYTGRKAVSVDDLLAEIKSKTARKSA